MALTDDPLARRALIRRLALGAVGAAMLPGCDDAMMLPDAGRQDAGALAMIDGGPGVDGGPASCLPTEPDAQGPFYRAGSPSPAALADTMEPGERIVIEGVLLSADNCLTRLPGYFLDLWQADKDGNYLSGTRLRGVFETDADGAFTIETILPGNYAEGDGFRPSHIHAKVFGPMGFERLTTQIYFADDPYLFPNDSCGPPTCNSDDPARIVRLMDTATTVRRGSLELIVPT